MNQDFLREDLIDLIKEFTGLDNLTPLITNQINRLIIEHSMNFKDIGRCLVYWVEIKGQQLQPQYGIGIVPSIKEEALKYFKQLELEKKKQSEATKKVIQIQIQGNNILYKKVNTKRPRKKVTQYDLTEIEIPEEEE